MMPPRVDDSSGSPASPACAAIQDRQEPDPGARGRSEVACRPAGEEDREAWDRFVASQPEAGLGHLFGWKAVTERAYGKRAFFLAAVQGERWVGVLPLVHMKGPLAGNRLVSLPFLDAAGVLAASPPAAEALWRATLDLAREAGAKGIDLRALAPHGTPQDRATLLLRLPAGSEALWKSFSPKVRNQVRKSEKEGLRTEPAGRERLGEFYGVFARNMRDLGSPVHSLRFLQETFEAFGPKAKLYLTSDAAGRVVGGAVALTFRSVRSVPWASSLREAFPSCPNHSLYWRILADTAEERLELFDFGRSHAGGGTYRFKTQWGTEPRPLLWSSYDSSGGQLPPKVYRPAEHPRLTWLWSRLPVWLATRLGPLVRRNLSN
ncbi:MAG: FemAB family PEP-CTERM system-associated protein [Planctomycetes bacterium]|nr:FemAB family PEP-CTERM system-associated protein [Planctomycetota bacterium]